MATTQLYWLHALSPVHVGTGQGIGYIDLPIHRDKVTGWPLIPGSAFKGVWADHYKATEQGRKDHAHLRLAFGVASDEQNISSAGALIPTDARLVCLPIRSFQGTFAWCTSTLALEMLRRDLELAGMGDLPPQAPILTEEEIGVTGSSRLVDADRVYLEDLDFQATRNVAAVEQWAQKIASWVFPGEPDKAWQERFRERFALVHDDVFGFLAQTGTEVSARVRIDAGSKTVQRGALWNEESLPAETILAGLVSCERIYSRDPETDSPQDLVRDFATQPLQLQIGGKASVGRGRMRCVFTPAAGGR